MKNIIFTTVLTTCTLFSVTATAGGYYGNKSNNDHHNSYEKGYDHGKLYYYTDSYGARIPYYLDNKKRKYYQDQHGEQFFYDKSWKRYRFDRYGNKFFL